MFLPILFIAATLPIIGLCMFIYFKDKNREPNGLLALIFILGLLSVIPVLFCELTFSAIFPTEMFKGFILIFIRVLFGVALWEELFKWLVTKYLGYHNKAFDEVFDVIVYAVFASLGFACFENILYVFQNGLMNAIFRALLAVPGHTCFAISMGYFFSKAKVGHINGNNKIYKKNLALSLIAPILLHTIYDAILFNMSAETLGDSLVQMIPFIIFYVAMVIVCFITVDKVAKVQQNLTTNLKSGLVARNDQGILYYNPSATAPVTVPVSVPETTPVIVEPILQPITEEQPVLEPVITPVNEVTGTVPTPQPDTEPVNNTLNYCPICGKSIVNENYCGGCGFKLK